MDFCGYAGKPSGVPGEGPTRKGRMVNGSEPAADAAGMRTGRITELSLHTRKRTDWGHKSSTSLKNLVGYPRPNEQIPASFRQRKSQLRYCGVGPEEQRQHFQTRWQRVEGKMAFCTSRRGGSATVECDYEYLDKQNTYHTWKRMKEGGRQHNSHLQVRFSFCIDLVLV